MPILNTGGYARGVPVDAEPGVFTMVFGRRAFFGYTVAPSGEVWWFANPPHLEEPTPAQLAALNDGDRWRRLLLDLFADDATPAVDLIRHTAHDLTGWATYDLPRVETWQRGRVVLVGDAAHATSPSSGQGASMAIEDAVVLGKCLRDLGDVESALAAYVGLRRARVERVVAAGARGRLDEGGRADRPGGPRPDHADRAQAGGPARPAGVDVRLPHRLGRADPRRGLISPVAPAAAGMTGSSARG